MAAQHRRTGRRADLSQHFLRSEALASDLIANSSITGRDFVIEIGAGYGALTARLAQRSQKVVAVEIDERLAGGLRDRFRDESRIEVVQADFLRFDLPSEPYKVFGNIPFGRTAEIIRRLVNAPVPPEDAYLIVQREAAERFAGGPYAHENQTSLLLKPYWQIEILNRLRKSDFDPPPRVESVLLWLSRRSRPLVDNPGYEGFITRAFGTGRTTIRQCLRGFLTARQTRRLALDLRFDDSAPPSALSFDQWLGLYRYFNLSKHGGSRRR